ncbi:hypothetical protein DIZ76_017061 [Coccidioides immitis]|nr:hypothetical protein DIZ76_017061 [Coccidioides immitis]
MKNCTEHGTIKKKKERQNKKKEKGTSQVSTMTLQGRFKLFQPTASFRAKLVILLYWNRAGKEVLNELSIVIFIVKDSLDCFKVGMKSASGSWERQSIPHAVGLGRKMDQRCDLGSNDRRLGEYLGTRDGVRRNLRPLCPQSQGNTFIGVNSSVKVP